MSNLSQHHEGDGSSQQHQDEVIKRIRKLRWIGSEDEARMLAQTLGSASPRAALLVFPGETD